MKLNDHIERLRRKASKSICRYRIAAIGFDMRGNPLCIKFNAPGFDRKGGGVHAEIAVIRHSPKNLYRIIIARVAANGVFLPIDPCDKCMKAMSERGIRYSTIDYK